MINYSIVMRGNPIKSEEPKKAYATAQYNEVININAFAEHIATHGSVYKRADIVAILMLAVDCMHELLLAGQKVELGDLGSFYVSLASKGADTAADFNPAVHIRKVKVNWDRGAMFSDLTSEATFNLVATRAAQAAVIKALKAGESNVDLSTGSTAADDDSTGNTDSGNTDSGNTDSGTDEEYPME